MLQAALGSGAAEQPAVFEVFTRRLPPGGATGSSPASDGCSTRSRTSASAPDEIDLLRETGVVNAATGRWLAEQLSTPPQVDIVGLAEGEAYGPGHAGPGRRRDVRARGPARDARAVGPQSRQRRRRCGRPHDRARRAAARASRWARGVRTSRPPSPRPGLRTSSGFEATSNLEAGRRYDIPTTGTSAHAFTLVHETERAAFEAQVASLGAGTTLLVDSYDVMEGVRTAVEVAGPGARRRPARQRRPRGARRRGPRAARQPGRDRRPASSSPATSTSTRSPRWRPHPSTATASAPRSSTGSGAPDRGLRLQARRARRPAGREALAGQALPRRAQDAWPAG